MTAFTAADKLHRLVKQALDSGRGVAELVLEQKLLTRKQLDEILDPKKMAAGK